MEALDPVEVLERLGVEITEVRGDEVWGFCPDHHLFVRDDDGRSKRPSDPKWSLNAVTGQTHCYTEPRGSNLVWIVSRLRDCSADDAVKWIMGKDWDAREAELDSRERWRESMRRAREIAEKKRKKAREGVTGLDKIKQDLASPYRSPDLYDYFLNPPGKEPTNITKKTVDHFQVFERTWGYYINRAIVPYFLHGELIGFCAIDLLGEKEWLRRHSGKKKREYKKVLYPAKFPSGDCLYGFDEVGKGAKELIIVEGARERMKLWQEGFPNVVGTNGTNICDGHIALLSELAPESLTFMYDGDRAGRAAAWKGAKKLYRNFAVNIATVPWGKDPKYFNHKDLATFLKKKKKVDRNAVHDN